MTTPTTRPSLIARLADCEDAEAWHAFHAIYEPLLERLLSQWGLQPADRREVVQETLAAVADSVHRFQPREQTGSFRGWLARIARNKMVDLIQDQKRFPRSQGGSDFQHWLNNQPAAGQGLSRWDVEHRRAVFAWAAERVRERVQPRTWLAFQLTAIEGRTPSEAAHQLETEVGWIYVARSRVLARLREAVADSGEMDLAEGDQR